jgi:RimJ/RimL family protein N-acetyltransferase
VASKPAGGNHLLFGAMDGPNLTVETDGVVTLRPPAPGDAELLVEGRDDEFFRWLGPGAETPNPVACIWVGEELVGWVDYDVEHDWLQAREVNVGYFLFPAARGKGYASRAVELLLVHLDRDTEYTVATLMINPENASSIRLARRLGFVENGKFELGLFFVRDVRPVL